MRTMLLALGMLTAGGCCLAQEAPNLVTNPGFEESANGEPVGWTSGAVQGEPQFAIEPGDEGMCARITAGAPEDFGRWNQRGIEPVAGAAIYRLSARIRTDLRGATARVVPVYSRDGQWHGADYSAIVVAGETDWRRHSVLIRPRDGTTQIEVTLRVNFEKIGTGTAWFDDVRLEPLPEIESIPPIRYESEREPPELPEAARKAGMALFPRRLENIAMPGYVPFADEVGAPIEAWGAAGQRITTTFCIHALEDLSDVTVTVKGLPAERVSVRPAHVLVRLIHRSVADAIEVPTYLEAVDSMDITRGTTAWYWLTIDGLQPGRHSGEVAVSAGEEARATLPISVEVLPITLREPEAALGFYYHMRYAVGAPEVMREHFREMRARSMTGIGIVAGLHLEKRDGAPAVVWDAENELGVGMDAWAETGFTQPVIWLMSGVHRFCINEFGPLESEEFGAAYRAVIEQVQARAGEGGWPEVIYQPVDEPVGHEDRMAVALRCLPILRAAGVRTEEDGNLRPGTEDFEAMYPFVDLVNCNFRRHVEQQKLGTWESEMVRRCREDGKLLWTYNIDLCGYHPEVMRFGMGFGREACHSGGMIEWIWQAPRDDPYVVDPDRQRQNMTYWYAPLGERRGGPSTGLEGAAEGAIDAAYIATFNAAVARARASDDADMRALADRAVAEYQARLGEIRFTDLRTEMAIQGEWTVPKYSDEDGALRVSGEYRMPNGWEFAEYDRTRRLLADWIARLGG